MATATKKPTKKKSTRYRRVSEQFQDWLKDNPNAPRRKRIRMFNLIADYEADKAEERNRAA